MEPKFYTLTKIEGDYATLTEENGGEMFIAMALLPPNSDIGTKLKYYMFEYEKIE